MYGLVFRQPGGVFRPGEGTIGNEWPHMLGFVFCGNGP